MGRENCQTAHKVGTDFYCRDFGLCKDVKHCPDGYDLEDLLDDVCPVNDWTGKCEDCPDKATCGDESEV